MQRCRHLHMLLVAYLHATRCLIIIYVDTMLMSLLRVMRFANTPFDESPPAVILRRRHY